MAFPRLFPLFALTLALPLAAQPGRTMLVEPPGPLLPASLAGFTKSAPAPVGDGLGLVDPAQAPVLKEDGIRRFERSDYTAGTTHGTLTVWQFFDASGAYAAFCAQLPPGVTPTRRIGDLTAATPRGTLIRSGINVILARFDTPRGAAVLDELLPRLPKAAGPAGKPPLLPTYLPQKDLIPSTIRYTLGPAAYTATGGVLPANVIVFEKSAEAVTAAYKRRGENGIVTLLLYPTPTIAGDAGRAIASRLHDAPPAGTATLRREGPLVLLATGGFTPAEAQSLVDGIHLRNELTWNKDMPLEFHSEVRKTASLLTSIAVFCGVGALGAILLGLFLGGARAGVRVLMGKPAASEPEFLRIDLSGPPTNGPAAPPHA